MGAGGQPEPVLLDLRQPLRRRNASAGSAWAVGTVNQGGEVVILHWNGTSWANFTSANLLNYP